MEMKNRAGAADDSAVAGQAASAASGPTLVELGNEKFNVPAILRQLQHEHDVILGGSERALIALLMRFVQKAADRIEALEEYKSCEESLYAIVKERGRLRAELAEALEAMQKITQWCDAYPVDVFHEPTRDEWKRANEALKAAGLSGVDAFSASCMRHVLDGVRKIAAMKAEGK